MTTQQGVFMDFTVKGWQKSYSQSSPKEGAWSTLFSNLSKSGLDSYIVKRSKRLLLEEVVWSWLPFLMQLIQPGVNKGSQHDELEKSSMDIEYGVW